MPHGRCPVGTLSKRASRGLEQLRMRLNKQGFATSVTAIGALLTSEASAAIPETLLPSTLAAVKSFAATTAATTAASTKAMLLAKGAMKVMFWNQVKVAAMVAGVAAIGVTVPLLAGLPQPAAKESMAVEVPPPKPIETRQTATTRAPLQAGVSNVAVSAEDILAAIGGSYGSFKLPQGVESNRFMSLGFFMHEYRQGHETKIGQMMGIGGSIHFECDAILRVPMGSGVNWNLCGIQNSMSEAYFLWSKGFSHTNFACHMESNGLAVLAYDLPPGCTEPSSDLLSSTGAYRAAVLSISERRDTSPILCRQEKPAIPLSQVAKLLGMHCATVRVADGIDDWWAIFFEDGLGLHGSSGGSVHGNHLSVLVEPETTQFRIYTREQRREGESTAGISLVQRRHPIGQDLPSRWVDERGRLILRGSRISEGTGVLYKVDHTMPAPVPVGPHGVVSHKTRNDSDADELLVMQAGTGKDGRTPLLPGQMTVVPTPDAELAALLCDSLRLQPLRCSALSTSVRTIHCRLVSYTNGSPSQLLAETEIRRDDTNAPVCASVMIKVASGQNGTLRLDETVVPFSVSQWGFVPPVTPSRLDAQGRLLVCCRLRTDPEDPLHATPRAEDVTVSNAPEALVLEFSEP